MLALTRRHLLQQAGAGFGGLALQSLMGADGLLANTNPLAPRAPHFAPKAKSVIFPFMYGGPSHVDLFDPKPELARRAKADAGEALPQIVEQLFLLTLSRQLTQQRLQQSLEFLQTREQASDKDDKNAGRHFQACTRVSRPSSKATSSTLGRAHGSRSSS
jgi:hypothetical protein